jgi:hypothetical protein
MVGNVISTTPQLSSMQKIVGNCKKDFGVATKYLQKTTSQRPVEPMVVM